MVRGSQTTEPSPSSSAIARVGPPKTVGSQRGCHRRSGSGHDLAWRAVAMVNISTGARGSRRS